MYILTTFQLRMCNSCSFGRFLDLSYLGFKVFHKKFALTTTSRELLQRKNDNFLNNMVMLSKYKYLERDADVVEKY